MPLIHLGTQTRSQFAWVDDAGDIVETATVDASVPKLSEAGLADLLKNIAVERQKFADKFTPPAEPE